MTDFAFQTAPCRYTATAARMTAGDEIVTPLLNIKKNHTYTFCCKVESPLKLVIGHGRETYDSSYLTVESGKITQTVRYAESTTTDLAVPASLRITRRLTLILKVGVGSAELSLYCDGKRDTIPLSVWCGDGNAPTFALLEEGELSEVSFTLDYPDFALPVYAFGDSYFGMTSKVRWCNYLRENGQLDGVLLNAYPGEGTPSTLKALENFPLFGSPKIAVWTLGMNDASDKDGQPNPVWLDGAKRFIEYCRACGAEPVLSTIPTVPIRYHEDKNRFVRTCGCRYIDFAAAVGADPAGTWYPEMLYSDGVHPDVKGAVALYERAIADCPELKGMN